MAGEILNGIAGPPSESPAIADRLMEGAHFPPLPHFLLYHKSIQKHISMY
jgi:hypothetical protein